MKQLLLRTVKVLKSGEYQWIPSSLAFYLLIAMIPLIFSIALIIIRYLAMDYTIITSQIDLKEFTPYLKSFFAYINSNFGDVSIVVVFIVLIYSMYLASSGISGIMYAVNKSYGFEKIGFIKSYLLAFVTTIIIIVAILFIMLFISVIPMLFAFFNFNISFAQSYLYLLPLVYIVVHIIYLFVSNFKLRFKQIYRGAFFTTISIYLVVLGVGLLFRSSTTSAIFGSFATLILLIHFIFYISYCFYIGLVINVASYELENEVIMSVES